MDLRSIKEQIGRIKVYSSRNETARALEAAINALKSILKLSSPPTAEIRGLLHENLPFIFQDPLFKKYIAQPTSYQPGQEKNLLSIFVDAQKQLVEDQEKESYLATRERKQRLDKAFNSGIKLLEQKKLSEADAAFTEALTFYHDERRLFSLIVKALIKENQPSLAIDYAKKGLTFLPKNSELKELANIASRIKNGDQSAINEL